MSKSTVLAIIVAALGYFVDVYDLLLFSIVRISSLKDLGLADSELLDAGIFLINCQMAGLLIGGILWGILGDKKGRLSVLFGSILIYSLGNILNGFVTSVEQYAVLRFITGLGLAGELGAGITLVSEIMPTKLRGYGTTLIATVGVAGALAASLVGDAFHWRTSYFIGGGLGIILLFLRIAVAESGLFNQIRDHDCKKGDLSLLFSGQRLLKYLSCIAIGIPIWFGVGIIVTFSPEIGKALNMPFIPSVANSVFYAYLGLTVGDLCSGVVSQISKSRKKCIVLFILLSAVSALTILRLYNASVNEFYFYIAIMGFAMGYWAVFITTAAEQFGTNLRATVTTTAPNFVRGSVIPITLFFDYLKSSYGILTSASIVGCTVISLALLATLSLRETFGSDMDFIEK